MPMLRCALHSTRSQPSLASRRSCSFRLNAGNCGRVSAPSQTLRRKVACQASSDSGVTGLPPELKKSIDNFVQSNKVVVFMKGNRQFPQCGFSNTVVQIMNVMEVPYETVDILENEMLRSGMKEYSQWPTFPQVYIDGEFFGGCDIMIEAYQSGALKEELERAMNS